MHNPVQSTQRIDSSMSNCAMISHEEWIDRFSGLQVRLSDETLKTPSSCHPSTDMKVATTVVSRAMGSDSATCISAPSAGGRYPYEIYVASQSNGRHALYKIDFETRSFRLLKLSSDSLQSPNVSTASLTFAVVERPWKSASKYGDRGWWYTQIDAGHALTQLELAARFSNGGHVERLEVFDLAKEFETLHLDKYCRAVFGGFRMRVSAKEASIAADFWKIEDWTSIDGSLYFVDSCERLFWDHIRCCYEVPENRKTFSGLASEGVMSTTEGFTWEDFILATKLRESAKKFERHGLSTSHIPQLLETTAFSVSEVDHDLCASVWLDPELISKPPGGIERRLSSTRLTWQDKVRMFNGQTHLGHAAGALVFHCKKEVVPHSGPGRMKELLTSSAQIAQHIYLQAALKDVGITAIGGFDDRQLTQLLNLSAEDTILYAVLFGAASETSYKPDRAEASFYHGER